jgi:hypothetical protein
MSLVNVTRDSSRWKIHDSTLGQVDGQKIVAPSTNRIAPGRWNVTGVSLWHLPDLSRLLAGRNQPGAVEREGPHGEQSREPVGMI